VDCICISKNDKTYADALLGGELYKVKMTVIPPLENVLAAVKRDSSATDLRTWHQRLGHLGDTMLKALVGSSSVKDMEITNTQLVGTCTSCILGKMDEKLFEARSDRDSQVFRTLHADLIGLMTLEARWSRVKFSLIVHDDCSSFGFAFNLTHKDQTAKTLIELDKAIENKFQKRIHTLKSDNGGEFINNELQTYCRDRGISSMTSVAHNPELNG